MKSTPPAVSNDYTFHMKWFCDHFRCVSDIFAALQPLKMIYERWIREHFILEIGKNMLFSSIFPLLNILLPFNAQN